MRELKFRSWNGDGQRIRPDYITRDGVAHWREDSIPTSCDLVEQFTGLRDKNGVEIYEGDILATSNAEPEYDIWSKEDNGFTTVRWSDEWARFYGDNWGWDTNPEEESIYALGKFVEVIGNIHENPELLEAHS